MSEIFDFAFESLFKFAPMLVFILPVIVSFIPSLIVKIIEACFFK